MVEQGARRVGGKRPVLHAQQGLEHRPPQPAFELGAKFFLGQVACHGQRGLYQNQRQIQRSRPEKAGHLVLDGAVHQLFHQKRIDHRVCRYDAVQYGQQQDAPRRRSAVRPEPAQFFFLCFLLHEWFLCWVNFLCRSVGRCVR